MFWTLKSSCFEILGDGKYGLFMNQKGDGKVIFTWSFWAFQDIPGIEKYRFSYTFTITSRDIGYLQTDGIAMDSPLGPVLNEISMIQSKMSLLILLVPELSFWKQYVNDTIIFIKIGTVDRILAMLN